ncbi:MAG TPA: AbrB family transcriptional regulator [Armatimonadetes bacterium]|jgi:AbrB family looped-hinge helix DNA binding protein|nr:AbrB family transcriptional regulator [Armatimonadota bacterium]
MQTVRVAKDYRITIPGAIRTEMGLRPGQKLLISVRDGVVRLVPVASLDELQGIARGASAHGLREKEDRV